MSITLNVEATRKALAWLAVVSFWLAFLLGFIESIPSIVPTALWIAFAATGVPAILISLFFAPSADQSADVAAEGGLDQWDAAVSKIRKYAPAQGWDAFLLLVAALGVVVWSVLDARWVETPGLLFIVWGGAVTGMVLARVNRSPTFLLLTGLAIGGAVVFGLGSTLIEGPSGLERLRELWSRLDLWYEAVVTGGISTDLLPFTVSVLAFGWLMGFLSAWFLFRSSNVWIAVLLPSVALLTNLSFLPDALELRFFLFLFLIMLLVARISMIQRQQDWRRSSVRSGTDSGRFALASAIALSALVLLAAAATPLIDYTNPTATSIYLAGRSPVARAENEFARLFSGIASRKDIPGRFWGTTLPFQGKIGFDGDVVMHATAQEPTYYLAQTYSEYTSKGWRIGETNNVRVGPESGPPPPQESIKRVPLTQVVEPDFDTSDVLTGGNIQWLSREAVVETLAPKEFEIDLSNSAGDDVLPADIRELAAELRQTVSPADTTFLESQVSRLLPLDLVLKSVDNGGDSGSDASVVLERKEPLTQDIVSWRFAKQLNRDESYAMGSLISAATNDELRAAGTNYSGFVTDHYLQLPNSLPDRVGELAEQVTANAETPLDKALAIEDFLRGAQFEYDQKIDAPPRDADGVDNFLFETQEGYSDYFASAMAVMLRTLGIPARFAAGYAPGQLDPETLRWAVKDSDSHGWTQAYFPGHGWIDFEPTNQWPALRRESVDEPSAEEEEVQTLEDDLRDDLVDPLIRCAELESLIAQEECLEDLELGTTLEPPAEETETLLDALRVPLFVGGGSVLAIVVIWLIVAAIWGVGLRGATEIERIYTKMSRLGALAGIARRSQETPREYARNVGSRMPPVASGARHIADTFAESRYGSADIDDVRHEAVTESWRSIRGILFRRSIKRLFFLGGA